MREKHGDLRPVGLNYTWRRVVVKCTNSDAVARLFHQYAHIHAMVGTLRGAEAEVLAIRRSVTTMHEDSVLV